VAARCAEKASFSLQRFLQRFCSSSGVAYLKISFMNEKLERSFGWPSSYTSDSVGAVEIDLEATPSNYIWNKLFSRNRRKKIMRYEREGYRAQEARTRSDLREFYVLYCDTMKNVGARPYPYQFLENMWTLLHPLNLRIWLVAKEEAIGGMLVLKDIGRRYLLLAGIDRKQGNPHGVLNYLYWREIRTAEEEGCKYVSLGATPSDPSHPYYVKKTSFGGSFIQQKVVYHPCSPVGRVILQGRAAALSGWKTIRSSLPIRFKRIVEKELQSFL